MKAMRQITLPLHRPNPIEAYVELERAASKIRAGNHRKRLQPDEGQTVLWSLLLPADVQDKVDELAARYETTKTLLLYELMSHCLPTLVADQKAPGRGFRQDVIADARTYTKVMNLARPPYRALAPFSFRLPVSLRSELTRIKQRTFCSKTSIVVTLVEFFWAYDQSMRLAKAAEVVPVLQVTPQTKQAVQTPVAPRLQPQAPGYLPATSTLGTSRMYF